MPWLPVMIDVERVSIANACLQAIFPQAKATLLPGLPRIYCNQLVFIIITPVIAMLLT